MRVGHRTVVGADAAVVLVDDRQVGAAGGLLDVVARAPGVAESGRTDQADARIIVTDRPGVAGAHVCRPVEGHAVDPLHQRVLRRDQSLGDLAGIHVAGAHGLAAGEEARERGRQVAQARVVARPVVLAAVVVVAEIARGLGVAAHADARREERRLRRRQRGQIDHAATEFAGEARRIGLLHQRRCNDIGREQVERDRAAHRLRTRQRRAVEQRQRVAVAETANVDESVADHAQARDAR